MTNLTITCPKCGTDIEVNEVLTAQLEKKISTQIQTEMEIDYKNRIAKEIEELDIKHKSEINKLEEKARDELSLEIDDLHEQIKEKSEALENSKKQELELRKRQREIDEKERNLELELEKKIGEETEKIRQQTIERISQEHLAKDLEKDKKLRDMTNQIEELKRKAEQGSQQTQGEAIELELERLLKSTFVDDEIEPVSKGVKGADIIQKVRNKREDICGTILWESKNTKRWSDSWLSKLRDDQRERKADFAVLASIVLPSGTNHFGLVEGIWVTELKYSLGLAAVLRMALIQVANTKLASAGKDEKAEILFNYLLGTEFRQRIEAIVESFINLKEDLDQEKRAMESTWARREKQIYRAIKQVAGMWGEMGGILGTALPKIEQLELPSSTSE